MNTISVEKTFKRTFSIKNAISKRLNNYKNKSKIVNQALIFYFQKEDYLKKAEQEFFDSIELEDFSEKEIKFLLNSNDNKELDNTISKMKF